MKTYFQMLSANLWTTIKMNASERGNLELEFAHIYEQIYAYN